MQPPPYGPPGAPNPYSPPQSGYGPPGGGYGGPGYDPAEVQARIDGLNKKSFVFGVPGLALQVVGNVVSQSAGTAAGSAVSLVGTVLLVYGLSFYARSRGQNPWLGLLGLLSCLGMIILAVLPRRCVVCGGPVKAARCQQCGAPGAK